MVVENPQIMYLDTMGCPENRFDVAQLEGTLAKMGIRVTRNLKEADTIVLNTCGLTEGMEQICMEMLKKLQGEASPGAQILVTGCLPIIHGEVLKDFEDVRIIRGPLIESFPWETPFERGMVFNPALFPQRVLYNNDTFPRFDKGILWNLDRLMYKYIGICPPGTDRCFIKVASGCNRFCTFCAVRISRGSLKSRQIEWVIDRFKRGIDAGYRDFSLIGTNVSAYGQDIGISLPVLLRKILEFKEPYTLNLRNLEPEDIISYLPEYLEILKSGRIRYMEFPLESGSDRILKLMNRSYTVDEYVHALRLIKQTMPGIFIRSRVMIGFPTETEEDFQASVRYAAELPFVFVEPFCFSPRPGTAAARLEGQISPREARRRLKVLHTRLMKSRLGYKLRVLSGCIGRQILCRSRGKGHSECRTLD